MRHKKEHHEKSMHHKEMAKEHHRLAKSHMKIAQGHEKEAEKTKRALGMITGGEVMKIRDRHEPRATENGIREKRKYTKRK